MKKLTSLIICGIILFAFSGCADKNDRFLRDDEIKVLENNITGTITFSYKENEVEKFIPVKFELFYNKAPITVTNFVKLVKDNFYDDTYCVNYSSTFGGVYLNADVMVYNDEDPQQLVQKELDYNIKGEFKENGWDKNDIQHKFGTMSMLRGNGNDTASAPFMITLDTDSFSYRNEKHAAFGKITVENTLMNFLKGLQGSLQNYEFKIKTITIDTATDVDLGEPLKIKK